MSQLTGTAAKVVLNAYLFLPLALATVAGICLLVAALRKTLTGGAALALGGLAGLIVAGSIHIDAQNLGAHAQPDRVEATAGPDLAAAVSAEGATTADATTEAGAEEAEGPVISAGAYKIAGIGYTVLPLGMAAIAGLALLISTFRKSLNGAVALALGGLAGIVVVGSAFGLRGAEGEALGPMSAHFVGHGTEPGSEHGAVAATDLTAATTGALTAATTGAAPAWQTLEAAQEQAAQLGRVESALQVSGATVAGLNTRLEDALRQNERLRERETELASQSGELKGRLAATEGRLEAQEKRIAELARMAYPIKGMTGPLPSEPAPVDPPDEATPNGEQ